MSRRGDKPRKSGLSRKSEWMSCKSKRRFTTEHDAYKVINAHQRERGAGYLRIYECQVCRGWHFTSQKGNNNAD